MWAEIGSDRSLIPNPAPRAGGTGEVAQSVRFPAARIGENTGVATLARCRVNGYANTAGEPAALASAPSGNALTIYEHVFA